METYPYIKYWIYKDSSTTMVVISDTWEGVIMELKNQILRIVVSEYLESRMRYPLDETCKNIYTYAQKIYWNDEEQEKYLPKNIEEVIDRYIKSHYAEDVFKCNREDWECIGRYYKKSVSSTLVFNSIEQEY